MNRSIETRLRRAMLARAIAVTLLSGLVIAVPAAVHADSGTIATGLGWATGSAVAPNGEVAVTSYSAGTVTVFRGATPVATYSGFAHPHDVAYDSRGNMFVAQFGRDAGVSRIARIDAATKTIDYAWQSGFVGIGGIAVASDGAIWVADSDGGALYRVTAAHEVSRIPGSWPAVHGIRFASDGSLYLAAYNNGQILKRTPDGQVSAFASGLSTPVAVIPDDAGGVYVAEQHPGVVSLVGADGSRTQVAGGIAGPTGLSIVDGRLWVSTSDSARSIVALATAADSVAQVMPGTNHAYLVISSPTQGSSAPTVAVSRLLRGVPGEMAHIGNDAENSFIASFAPDNSWIGGAEAGSGFSKWAPSEPSGDGSCIMTNFTRGGTWPHLSHQGFWNDESCDNSHAFIIEWDLSKAVNSDSDSQVMPGTSHRYTEVSGNFTWAEAAAYARTLRSDGLAGHLATIESSDEQKFIQSVAPDGGWLGAQSQGSDGSPGWSWTQAPANPTAFAPCAALPSCSAEAFTRWLPGQPVAGTASGEALALGQAEKPGEQVSGGVSEYSNLALNAPAGTVFTSVRFASYGTPNDSSYGWCHSGISADRVGAAFLGRTSGVINANNGEFGDPCLGTYKRLRVILGYGGSYWRAEPTSTRLSSFIVEFEPTTPSPVQSVTAASGDGALTVSWTPGPLNEAYPATAYTATAEPGGATCAAEAPSTSCRIEGLTNRTAYTVSVRAVNDYGASDPVESMAVVPLAPGFQVWTAPTIINPGGAVQVHVGNAPANSSVKVTAPGFATTVRVDASGYASFAFLMSKPSIATLIARAGKSRASATVYAPQVVVPSGSPRWGSQMRFSVKYLPADSVVTFEVGAASVTMFANSKGVATATFLAQSKGRVTYTASLDTSTLLSGAVTVK